MNAFKNLQIKRDPEDPSKFRFYAEVEPEYLIGLSAKDIREAGFTLEKEIPNRAILAVGSEGPEWQWEIKVAKFKEL